MIPYLIGLSTLIGGVRPYVRKHILDTIDPSDFVFINSFLISSFVVLYFGYLWLFDNYSIKTTYTKCCALTPIQFGGLVVLAAFTVISSILILNLEKYFNTPAINHMMLKAVSLVMLFVVGVFIFNENYKPIHIAGVGLTMVGILILFLNPMRSV